ncbi:MAG: hypothetical protein P8X42_10105 [Calditrichaceae bacterium]
MRFIFFIMGFLFLVEGCSKTHIIIMPEYKDIKVTEAVLAVAPFLEQPVIENESDFKDDFGEGDIPVNYQALLHKEFISYLQRYSRFSEINFAEYAEDVKFKLISLPLNKEETISFKLPETTETIRFDSLDGDYILFINKWIVSRRAGTPAVMVPGANGMMTSTGGTPPALVKNVTFLIWDNRKHKTVSYGKVTASQDVMFAMTKNTWYQCLEKVAKNMMKDSPFYKEYIKRVY